MPSPYTPRFKEFIDKYEYLYDSKTIAQLYLLSTGLRPLSIYFEDESPLPEKELKSLNLECVTELHIAEDKLVKCYYNPSYIFIDAIHEAMTSEYLLGILLGYGEEASRFFVEEVRSGLETMPVVHQFTFRGAVIFNILTKTSKDPNIEALKEQYSGVLRYMDRISEDFKC